MKKLFIAFTLLLAGVMLNGAVIVDNNKSDYEIIVRREGYLDTLEILVEPADSSVLENYGTLEGLQSRIRARLRVTLQLDAAVRLVEPNTLKRFEGKGKYVTDLRNLKN